MKIKLKNLTTSDARGMTFMTVIFMLVVVIPIAMLTYRMTTHTLRTVTQQMNKKNAVEMANDALVDYMRQFSNSPYSSVISSSALLRNNMKVSKGQVQFFKSMDKKNRTLFLKGVGKFGLNPANPNAKQTMTAVIKFQSDLTFYAQDMMRRNTFNPNVAGVQYIGPIVMKNGSIDASNIQFIGGPVVVTNNWSNTNMGSVTNPFIDGNLYVGGTLTHKSGTQVSGTISYVVPQVPDFFIDFKTYDLIAGRKYTAPVTLLFEGDGKYRESNDYDTYVSNIGAGIPAGVVTFGSTRTVPNSGIFLTKGANIGLMGMISPRVTIVAFGNSGATNQGNIVVIDNIWYLAGSSKARDDSALALLALNQIFIKKRDAQDLSIRGVFYSAYGVSQPGVQAAAEIYMEFYGGANAKMSFYGTRNAMFRLNGSPFPGGGTSFYQGPACLISYDPDLVAYPPPGLPEHPVLVSYSIQ